MLSYITEFFSVIGLFVKWIFTLQIVNGVSIGSILLVALLLWIIVDTFWVRR